MLEPDRFEYSPIVDRPIIRWPNNARVASWVAPNLEHYEYMPGVVGGRDPYDERPSDSELLIPSLEAHQRQLGRTPRLVAADAAFFSTKAEAAAHAMGARRIAIPNRSTKSVERKWLEKKRWFRNAQKWCTGSEGRISLLKRRHGLDRCRYKGPRGMQRWSASA